MPHQQVFQTEKVERSQEKDESMESASLEGDSDEDLYPKFVPYHPQNLSPPQEVMQQIPR